MKLEWAGLAVATVLLGAVCAVIYAGLARAIHRAAQERQQEWHRRLSSIEAVVKALEARVAELGRLQSAHSPEIAVTPIVGSADKEAGGKREGVKPEIVAVLTAAATTFLGNKAHVPSANLLPSDSDSAGAWAQQGRVIVQTSHNLRPRQ